MIAPDYARRFGLVSAWAELVGYVGSVWLNVLRISAALERERALSQELTRRKKARMTLCFLRQSRKKPSHKTLHLRRARAGEGPRSGADAAQEGAFES